MLLPIIWGAAGAGVYQALGTAWSMVIDPLTEPGKLRQSQKAWAASPILLPTVDQLQLLLLQGRATTPDDAMAGMLAQGVYPFGDSLTGALWRDVMEARRPRPGIADIIQAYLRGVLTWAQVCTLLRGEGALPDQWTWAVDAGLAYPTILDAAAMRNRGIISDELFGESIRRAGYVDRRWYHLYNTMRQSLPGPQDVIRFVVREALNDEQAKILGLDEEYGDNKQYPELCTAVGMGKAEYVDSDGMRKTIDTPKLYWRAHWQLPSPTQSYDWLRRLRPNRIQRFQATLPADLANKLKPFTGEMLESLLKANDYAPQWRPYLAASSYLPLTRVDARRLYDSALISKKELTEQYLDQGYVKDDAEKMADWAESDRDLSRRKQSSKALAKEAIKGYETGWMTRDAAARAIYPTVVLNAAELADWLLLPEDQQAQAALGHHRVQAELAAVDARLRTQQWTEAIRSTTVRVLDGMITIVQGRAELVRLGMTQARVDYWVSRWSARLAGPRRTLVLRQLVQYQQQGIITPGELVRRAGNLGYPSADLRIIMAGAERNVRLALARQAAAEAKTAQAQAAAAARQIRELEREMERARQALAWKVPATTIVRWATEGRISRTNAAAALTLKGHKASEIQHLLADISE